ncbi:MAG: glycoside hydrolase family 2 TIM barrel-domain containing protein [Polaribacter sp.]|uniref:glycoside hydrolase family 2 protein n=1 Tax=Polaribacter sp. TaxID=1920175 RepID=UPI003BB17A34
MNLNFKVFILILFTITCSFAQEKLLQNVYNKQTTSLNGMWKYIVDPYENGFYNYRYEPFEDQKNPSRNAFFKNAKAENKTDLLEYNFDKSDSIKVPSDWNTRKENLFYYEGTVWYKKSFDYKTDKKNNRVFVYFGASNYETDVYFNGKKLGKHIGGFTPFNFEITSLLKETDNFLVVKVDNKRKKEAVPTLNTDWWNYGGITRDVKLVEVANNFIEDYFIQLNKENKNEIIGKIALNGSDISTKEITINIPELRIEKKVISDKNGVATFTINSNKIKYWSTKNPKLYEVILNFNSYKIKDKIGFRTIKTSGHSILLNDEKIYLKGISIHEESPITGGRGNSFDDAKKLLTWAKELGCNYVRLAHYPHNENMLRLADEMGILVWEENPVYWTISWENETTYNNAKNQLSEVIQRDKNRASVIIWSMANETPTSEARNEFLKKLADFTRKEDPTRLISAALEQSDHQGNKNIRTISDEFADVVDVLSFNQYIGWYDGLPDKTETITWKITQNKPVLISEFGAGAKKDFYADKDTRWSEEYQANLYDKTIKMIDKIEQLQGFSPWILVDFRSPRRVLPEIQDGWNRKGLISEKGEKKKAFFVLKNFYDTKN